MEGNRSSQLTVNTGSNLTVIDAPHNTNGNNYHRPRFQLLQKEAISCPVSAVALPNFSSNQSGEQSRQMCLVGRGPWVDMIPLESKEDIELKATKHLVFGKNETESGSVHGMKRGFKVTDDAELWAFYGERKVAFVTIGPYEGNSDERIKQIPTARTNSVGEIFKSHLTLSDWIWDVRLISMETGDDKKAENEGMKFLSAFGLAHNCVEIWSLYSNAQSREGLKFQASKMRKLVCNVRCITYSLSLFGWKYNYTGKNSGYMNNELDLQLAVAAGTVTNQILIWSALDENDCTGLMKDLQLSSGKESVQFQSKTVCHTLSGHEGVIYSCKFGGDGEFIASTSDDRTVRLWRRKRKSVSCVKSSVSNEESPVLVTNIVDSDSNYELLWTGFGHTCRVFDCDFVRLQQSQTIGVVTSGEDGTIRIWNESGNELATMRGHTSQNIWKICGNGRSLEKQIILSGGNDGTAKLWDIDYHLNNDAAPRLIQKDTRSSNIQLSSESVDNDLNRGQFSTLTVPEDIIINCPSNENINILSQKSCDEPFGDKKGENSNSHGIKKKKKKSKNKQIGQVICGMKFYPKSITGRLLLATRKGMLFSVNIKSAVWNRLSDWVGVSNQIDPSTGCCMAIHMFETKVAIGTTRGDVVLSSINTTDEDEKIIFSSPKYKAVQGIQWIDETNLIVFHIKGIVVWWEFPLTYQPESSCSLRSPTLKRVLSMGLNRVGVPISFSFDVHRNVIYIGDSRGNIAVFDLDQTSEDDKEQYPADLQTLMHQKEHVNTIITTKRGILSAGNDGRISECTISNRPFKLRKELSRPVSNLSGINYLWKVKQMGTSSESIIVGGYHGNKFVLWDDSLSYQLLSVDTCGRQRPLDLNVDFSRLSHDHPTYQELAILIADKKGPNKVLAHSSVSTSHAMNVEEQRKPLQYSFCSPCHGDTILDAVFCESIVPYSKLIISGSNDCTLKISRITTGSILFEKELDPDETCLRAVCSSRHKGSQSSLLVACGGKLSMTFYRLEETHDFTDDNIAIHRLCSSKPANKPSIDHRMNAVKAMPLSSQNSTDIDSHLVLSGDSNGGLHLTVVSEAFDQPHHVSSRSLILEGRPILSIDLIRISQDNLVACIGNTAGEVAIWILPGVITIDGQFNHPIPEEPLHKFQCHEMGANSVALANIGCSIDGSTLKYQVLLASGGDDQALACSAIEIEIGKSDSSKKVMHLHGGVIARESSSSAIKGVKVIGNYSRGFNVYVVGYDQRLVLWSVDIDNLRQYPQKCLKFLSSAPVDVFDVNCLDACLLVEENGISKEFLLVGGQGMEILSFDPNPLLAARAIRKSDHLLVTCGAGFSEDSGLSTYESMPSEYSRLCDPLRLTDETKAFQSFWMNFAQEYENRQPHLGYSIMEQWCKGKVQGLEAKAETGDDDPSPWWIYSSNVDGHFHRFECFKNTVCEIHGRASEFRCSSAVGYDMKKKRSGVQWNEWNDNVKSNVECNYTILSAQHFFEHSQSLIMECMYCSLPMRPNVLMFHDTDENVLRDIEVQRNRYQEWEEHVETRVVEDGLNFVVLELGAGTNVPAVREESEEVFKDCLERIKGNPRSKGNVTLIRINPKDFSFRTITSIGGSLISVPEKAAKALQCIDNFLTLLR